MHSISFRSFKLYTSRIFVTWQNISIKDYIFQAFHILQGRSIIHIDMHIFNFSVTTKLIKILNEIVSLQKHIFFFIINTRFLQETLLHNSYFVLYNFIKFSYKYPLVFKQALHLQVYGLQVQIFHILLMSLALFEFHIGQAFLR